MQLGAESEHHLPDVHTYPTPRLKISSVPYRTISFTLFVQLLWAWLSSTAAVRAFFSCLFSHYRHSRDTWHQVHLIRTASCKTSYCRRGGRALRGGLTYFKWSECIMWLVWKNSFGDVSLFWSWFGKISIVKETITWTLQIHVWVKWMWTFEKVDASISARTYLAHSLTHTRIRTRMHSCMLKRNRTPSLMHTRRHRHRLVSTKANQARSHPLNGKRQYCGDHWIFESVAKIAAICPLVQIPVEFTLPRKVIAYFIICHNPCWKQWVQSNGCIEA